jgi:uncharacterized protein YdeI (YjbR/CyaY-like superfamily)
MQIPMRARDKDDVRLRYAIPGMPAQKSRTFTATLEPLRANLGWVIARVPFDVHQLWGTRSRIKVKVTVGDETFRTSLFPTREGAHFILVNKKMQRAGRVKTGMRAEFTVEPDIEERSVRQPAEFAKILKREKAAQKWFSELSHSMRHYIGKWIAEPKSAASRQKRAEEMAERILATMAAEAELPPALRVALDRVPHARAGWEKLTPTQRRHHLLGYFYYKTPEAKARRFQKAIDDAVAAAERATSSRR